MRLIDAEQTAKNFKDVSVRQKYEELKIDGRLTVGEVIDAVIIDLMGSGLVGEELAPTVPAIPMERIKQLREEIKGYKHGNGNIYDCALNKSVEFIDNMIKEYSE